jgi:hypothetical protein
MSDRADDSSDPPTYAAAGLPPGLSINPSTGVCFGVLCLRQGGQDPVRPAALISDGVPVPLPDPDAPPDNPDETTRLEILHTLPGDTVTFAATNLPPGLRFAPDSDPASGSRPGASPPAPPPSP